MGNKKIFFTTIALSGSLVLLLILGYFVTSVEAKTTVSTKQFEGIWKPVKFFEADYSLNELVEKPVLTALDGYAAKYLHFKGDKVCVGGFLEGPMKKLCSDSAEPKFREFFSTQRADGGLRLNVWADDQKTYTIPVDLEMVNGQLKETFGSGSEKFYEKVKNTDTPAKKTFSKKAKKQKPAVKSSKKS